MYLCQKCKEFTMKTECPKCNSKTVNPKPGKFSVEDKYAEYRLKAKGMIK
ncbi:ribosome biogenesis protein [Candidatus Woesearchaeota archaeon]|nr:ribosome biogenesis protein [Candidatus Woesearchaeota archaeon]